MIIFALAFAPAGVAITDISQLFAATTYANCIVHETGVAPAALSERQAKVAAAVRQCRDELEAVYAAGKIRLSGHPFPKSWWRRTGKLLDRMAAEASSVIMAAPVKGTDAGTFKMMWRLPDGKLVPEGNLNLKFGAVRVLILPN